MFYTYSQLQKYVFPTDSLKKLGETPKTYPAKAWSLPIVLPALQAKIYPSLLEIPA